MRATAYFATLLATFCATIFSQTPPADPSAIVRPRTNVKFAAIRASTPMLPKLEQLDADAYQAQLKAFEASKKEEVRQAFSAYFVAEGKLRAALDLAWKAMPSRQGVALLADEPLATAFFELQVLLRQSVGPLFSTTVAGLAGTQACSGDISNQQLIYRYGKSITDLSASSSSTAARDALHRIAVQVACLSQAQLAELESATSIGFEQVADELTARGLRTLIPAFVRAMAPVQILILDARKHRGTRSRSWRWFVTYAALLKDDVARAGWASGPLLLWDRRTGQLDAFSACGPSSAGRGCVDWRKFLNSITDPRALGMGNCALAAMVSAGPKALGSSIPSPLAANSAVSGSDGTLYVCPMRSCSSSEGLGIWGMSGGSTSKVGATMLSTTGSSGDPRNGRVIPAGSTTAARLKGLWPDLRDGAISSMSSLCRAPGDTAQGMMSEPQSCVDDIQRVSNPFDDYAACMTKAGADSPPQVGETYPGVPMGSACKLSQGDPTPAPALTSGTTTSTSGADSTDEKLNKKAEEASWIVRALLAIGDAAGFLVEGAAAVASRGVTAIGELAVELVSKHGAEGEGGGMISTLETELMKAENSNNGISQDDYIKYHDMLSQPGGPAKVATFLLSKAKECTDEGACGGSCTGLGQQLQAAGACTQGLLNALARATGRPVNSDLPRNGPSRGPVSYPTPDSPLPAPNSSDFCSVNDPQPQNRACGLILCADGYLAGAGTKGCACGQGGTQYKPIVSQCMLTIRCPDGQMPTDNCQCTSSDGLQPSLNGTGPPRPPVDDRNPGRVVR